MREYIVQVYDPVVWEAGLWDQITLTDGGQYIPHRPVEVVNDRPFNDYVAHFNLTDAEAELLKKDPRIKDISLPIEQIPGVQIGVSSIRPTYSYDKQRSTTDAMKNWGLWRCTHSENVFGSDLTKSGEFTYNLDGTGVDIIFIDTGIEPNHPEFAVNADGTGGSRVIDFDWHSLGVTGCPTSASVGGYLGDVGGHGSNCASIAAGNTCGWASGAHIYSIRIDLNEGSTDISTGATKRFINYNIVYDIVKAFHLKKITDGNPRPTICSNSWGVGLPYGVVNSTVWRGTRYAGSQNSNLGQVSIRHGVFNGVLNQSVDNASDSGVIMVGAAGNDFHKIDVAGGIDYDNNYDGYIIINGIRYNVATMYYHRGGSPTSAVSMITVGAIDNSVIEQKTNFSNCGPRVDIYSPGAKIMGAYANKIYNTPAVPDPRNNQYYLNKIDGTSQAGPQVAGYLACIAQARPSMNVEDTKKFLAEHSLKNILNENTSAGNGYTNPESLQGGENKILYQPFKDSVRGTITS
jgi:hypothetical protein